jgi:hypothetical protein|tara:strand:+ start:3628 stop:3768 length:141 start_codon:yes stop_codon:yes gene_type:complete
LTDISLFGIDFTQGALDFFEKSYIRYMIIAIQIITNKTNNFLDLLI